MNNVREGNLGATFQDWKDQQDLLVKYNHIQLNGLITLLQDEIEKREDVMDREDSLNKIAGLNKRLGKRYY